MCGPFNRKGAMCSECADGFGLSVTSFGYRCVNCTGTAWYGVPLFLLLKFAPITALYFIVLIFQIRVTSAPLPCFIMYTQLTVLYLRVSPTVFFTADSVNWNLELDVKVILTLYGLFSLNFCHNDVLPPYCISSKLEPIHLGLINCISVLYPIALIFLTWLCVELHDRNFRPLVWLWRPFHRCFVRLRRSWDTKSDIIDVFTTFFIVSYDQLLIQSLMLLNTRSVLATDRSGTPYFTFHSILDPKSLHRHAWHLIVLPILLISLIFCTLPPLFLILYPLKTFRSCLSKCHPSSVALNIFVEKMQGCYRNGLNGGRDMRSFSGLYFFLSMVVFFVAFLSYLISKHFMHVPKLHTYSVGILLLITTLTIALAKPYKKAYMNYLDVLLLSIFTVLCFTISLSSTWHTMQVITKALLVIPLMLFIFFAVSKWFKCLVRKFSLRRTLFNIGVPQSSVANTPSASQSLLQAASTMHSSYGTM